jgi:hypothetical protein
MRDTFRAMELERDELQDTVADATAALRRHLSEAGQASDPVTLPPGALRTLLESLNLL